MFKTFAEWFQTSSKSAEDKNDFSHELAELVTALMVEAAAADGQIGTVETQLIADCVSSQFDLADDEMKQILDGALDEADSRIELHSLIARLRDKSDYEERIGVMEMVWMVVFADGRLDKIERQLMRRLAGLLFVSDVDSGLAAQSARQLLGLAGSDKVH
tara:strand:+ start:315 stop:794 length:480 start_codon:yes stop_codon:yes gene_type:complete